MAVMGCCHPAGLASFRSFKLEFAWGGHPLHPQGGGGHKRSQSGECTGEQTLPLFPSVQTLIYAGGNTVLTRVVSRVVSRVVQGIVSREEIIGK